MSDIPLNFDFNFLQITSLVWEQITTNYFAFSLFIINIILAVVIFLLTFHIVKKGDQIRKNTIEESISEVKSILNEIHNRASKINGNNLNASDVSRFLIRKSNQLEFYRFNILVNKSQCNSLSKKDISIIENAFETIDWVLDTYDRPDLPSHMRSVLWDDISTLGSLLNKFDNFSHRSCRQSFFHVISFGIKKY